MLHKGRSSYDYASLHENLQYFHQETASRSNVRDLHGPYSLVSAFELVRWPSPPEHYVRDMEERFRKGWYHGYDEALRDVAYLKRKGFMRPSEIYNILVEHMESTIRKWWKRWFRDDYLGPEFRSVTPRFKHPSWWEIRTEVLERDGNRCVHCGSTKRLEIDHIDTVADGGLPIPENLRTLCRKCHRGPGRAECEVCA